MDTFDTPVLEPEKLNLMEKQRSIIGAVSAKDICLLKEVLQKKDDPNQQSQINDALMLAVQMRQTDVVEELLNAGADVHAFDGYDKRNPILLTAIDIQALDIFELLIPKIKDFNVSNNSGTMMHAAVRTGDIALVKKIYQIGVNINLQHEIMEIRGGIYLLGGIKRGCTPLHEAVKYVKCVSMTDKYNYDFSVIEFLISNVRDIDARDGKGKTPLHEASILGNQESVKCLLDAGANPHLIDYSSNAPFMYALQHDNVELADLLAADINLHIQITDINASTDSRVAVYYAHMASRTGSLKTLEYVMQKGVDMSVKDNTRFDYTPLMHAIDNLNEKCIFALLNTDCGIYEVDCDGNTALENILDSSIPHADKILEMLIGKGADINRIHPKTGVTPLVTLMGYMKNKEMTRTCLAHGADINFVARNGDNALIQACIHYYNETVNIIMEHNINMILSDKVIIEGDGEYEYGDNIYNHMTALQISILLKNKETTDILLCAGCSLRNIHCWIEKSQHCEMLRENDPYYQKVFKYIDSVQHGPTSLQDLSRISILQAIGTENCDMKIDKLNLPEKMKRILPWKEYYAYRKKKLAFNIY